MTHPVARKLQRNSFVKAWSTSFWFFSSFLFVGASLAVPMDYAAIELRNRQAFQSIHEPPKVWNVGHPLSLFNFILTHAGSTNTEGRRRTNDFRVRFQTDGAWLSRREAQDEIFERGADIAFRVIEHRHTLAAGAWILNSSLHMDDGFAFSFPDAIQNWVRDPETEYKHKEEFLDALILARWPRESEALFNGLNVKEREQVYEHWFDGMFHRKNEWDVFIPRIFKAKYFVRNIPSALPGFFRYVGNMFSTRDRLKNDHARFVLDTFLEQTFMHSSLLKIAADQRARADEIYRKTQGKSKNLCLEWLTTLLHL